LEAQTEVYQRSTVIESWLIPAFMNFESAPIFLFRLLKPPSDVE
jgi:hypothetical protein